MPELPDLTVYIEALSRRVIGVPITAVRLASPFVLRTVEPKIADVLGKKVVAISRIGKRIVFTLEDELFLVIHLMVSGRFQWKDEPKAKVPGRLGLLAIDFPSGTLLLTEASTKKRASLHLARGALSLAPFARGGLEPIGSSVSDFSAALTFRSSTS